MEENFAVVGVLEQIEKSLVVLEHYVPMFFKGAPVLYQRQKGHWSSVNKNKFRPETSPEIKDLLRRNMTTEVVFYEYCKQRLDRQYVALGL